MDALMAGLAYVAPLIAFCALCAVLIGLLLPDSERRDARRRNEQPYRQARPRR